MSNLVAASCSKDRTSLRTVAANGRFARWSRGKEANPGWEEHPTYIQHVNLQVAQRLLGFCL